MLDPGEVGALERAVALGLFQAKERDELLEAAASSWSGGIAYQPFDVLRMREDPRLPRLEELAREGS